MHSSVDKRQPLNATKCVLTRPQDVSGDTHTFNYLCTMSRAGGGGGGSLRAGYQSYRYLWCKIRLIANSRKAQKSRYKKELVRARRHHRRREIFSRVTASSNTVP
ncbi:hypothetical protein TRVL_00040 [Trypanosoma vivax]|uniref:Uncharacterized protein n=1 Tax=Trypanosoma vivax (strain Y486) TaxID=1055687 RepID=G0U0S6_TRYVY|nr:hypothetical protein TRVL_00040 [Trypanosoma vivax]CCC49676.1 hypothetical protein, unlikely [Trypanosoma vivax Y486]